MTDLVDIIEAAYRTDGSDERWLERIVAAARPHLDQGLGVAGFFYDLSDPAQPRVWSPVFLGAPPGALEALFEMNQLAPLGISQRLLLHEPTCSTMSERVPDLTSDVHRQLLARLKIRDFLGIASTDPSGVGCLVGAPLPRQKVVSKREANVWSKIAGHLAAGARLRGAAQQARGELRRHDAGGAVHLWTGLVAGRWSLVDSFDHEGRRYLIARPNPPETPLSLGALSEREREIVEQAAMGASNKLIGYELGLAPSTVATHLANAAKKLGVDSRAGLIRAYRRARGLTP